MRASVLAIIPARGGSKGVPRKNVKHLAGKALIVWTIRAALESDWVTRTVVSTEDDEIRTIANNYGVTVVNRPVELAQDDTLIQPVLEHVIETLDAQEDYIMLLNPTSPLRDSQDISNAIYHIILGGNNTLLTAYESQTSLWYRKPDGTFFANYDFMNKPQRQKMIGQYTENGAIYIAHRQFLMEHHHFMGGRMAIFPMSESHSIDINTELDFVIAEALLGGKAC